MEATRGRTRDQGAGADETQDQPTQSTRLSINLGPDAADTLRDYTVRKGVSITEAVRRAISILSYIDKAQERGASLNLEESGKMKEIQFLC